MIRRMRGLDGHWEVDCDQRGSSVLLLRFWPGAKQWNVDAVDLWNPSETVQAILRRTGLEHEFVDRQQESITSLMWYGDDTDQITWMANEKYGWC